MEFNISSMSDLAITGVMGLMWWDVRNIRKEVSGSEEKTRIQREADIEVMHEKFLKKESHELLCENTVLRIEAKIDQAVDAITAEIKNGHK